MSKNITDEEIEKLAKSEYKLGRLSTLPQCNKAHMKRAAFIKGFFYQPLPKPPNK